MSIRIEIESIQCVDTEDWSGADHVYYIALLRCDRTAMRDTHAGAPIPLRRDAAFLDTTRGSALEINNGQTRSFGGDLDLLWPSPRVRAHAAPCREGRSVVGPIYFFDLDTLGDPEDRPDSRDHDRNLALWGVVLGHAAGAAAVALGLALGGVLGIWFGILLFFTSLAAGLGLLDWLLRQDLDEDDYLGGYKINVPVAGPPTEQIRFRLEGSSRGIRADTGRQFSGTSGRVDYWVTLQVTRE